MTFVLIERLVVLNSPAAAIVGEMLSTVCSISSLNELQSDLPPEDLMSQGLTLDFEDDSDELFAVFLGTFMELWQSSNSLDATCRFVADALEMSANELIQGRALYRASHPKNQP